MPLFHLFVLLKHKANIKILSILFSTQLSLILLLPINLILSLICFCCCRYAVMRSEGEFNCKLIVHGSILMYFFFIVLWQNKKESPPAISSFIYCPSFLSVHKEINRSLAHYSTVSFPPMIMNYLLSLFLKMIIVSCPFQKSTILRRLRRTAFAFEAGDLDASFCCNVFGLTQWLKLAEVVFWWKYICRHV